MNKITPNMKLIGLQRITRLPDVQFPMKVNRSRPPKQVKFDMLTHEGLYSFQEGFAKWQEQAEAIENLDYLEGSWEQHIEGSCLPESRLDSKLYAVESVTLVASTENDMEGFVNFELFEGQPIELHFIGVAPWNLRSVQASRFPTMAFDLMRFVFLLSQYYTTGLKDYRSALEICFESERGKNFMNRMFGISWKIDGRAKISVMKRGVRALLNGDQPTFNRSYAIEDGSQSPGTEENDPEDV